MSIVAAYSPQTPPPDFPEGVHAKLLEVASSRLRPDDRLSLEVVFALQAVSERFCALAEHDEDFTRTLCDHGDSPPAPHRYIQQRELFEFFVNGHAALDAFAYAACAIGAMENPAAFPLETDDDRRNANLRAARDRYRKAFPEARLAIALDELVASDQYRQWTIVRNVLTHRLTPGRVSWLSFRCADGTVITPKQPTTLSLLDDFVLDTNTTSSRRAWIATALTTLLGATFEFVSSTDTSAAAAIDS